LENYLFFFVEDEGGRPANTASFGAFSQGAP